MLSDNVSRLQLSIFSIHGSLYKLSYFENVLLHAVTMLTLCIAKVLRIDKIPPLHLGS